MEIFNTQKSCLIFFLVLLSCPIFLGHSLSPAVATEPTPAVIPSSERNNAPFVGSTPNDTPINKREIPFAKPVGNGNQRQPPQVGNQQQEPDYSQQSIDQPMSGFNQPYPTTTNQPYSGSGLNQPFSTFNQPFGANNQQGSVENAAFENGVTKQKTWIQGVIMVSLLTLMGCFGLIV